jgi:hypothetical protein
VRFHLRALIIGLLTLLIWTAALGAIVGISYCFFRYPAYCGPIGVLFIAYCIGRGALES